MAPQTLACLLQSLPPILHIIYSESIRSYSKGSQGLFVPLRVIGIFTDTTISPSSWLRQCPDRYTIRAGRNLPDKEFRYLRTVIVTAVLRVPLKASVTLLEATTPVKLPTKHCPRVPQVRFQINKGWYFNNDSTNTSVPASQSPTYPTHHVSKINVKL